jgi:hypothetical protein
MINTLRMEPQPIPLTRTTIMHSRRLAIDRQRRRAMAQGTPARLMATVAMKEWDTAA